MRAFLIAAVDAELIVTFTTGLIGSIIGASIPVFASWRTQKREFDHRVRMEKEYQLYNDLWGNLFELRRAVGQLIETLGTTAAVDHGALVIKHFNTYQTTVRKGEPFLHESVYAPARNIAGLARAIVANVGQHKELRVHQGQSPPDKWDWYATKLLELDAENESTFTKLDEMYSAARQAIRKRVTVQ
jgi:hypothetical protein